MAHARESARLMDLAAVGDHKGFRKGVERCRETYAAYDLARAQLDAYDSGS
jgi:hypothetical protein